MSFLTAKYPLLVFNNTSVSQSSSQKHLGVIIDSKLMFDEHLKMVSLKISKTLGLLQKLHNLLPRSELTTIYKAFVRPFLDCGYILYDQAYNMSFHHKLESIQQGSNYFLKSDSRKFWLKLGKNNMKEN